MSLRSPSSHFLSETDLVLWLCSSCHLLWGPLTFGSFSCQPSSSRLVIFGVSTSTPSSCSHPFHPYRALCHKRGFQVSTRNGKPKERRSGPSCRSATVEAEASAPTHNQSHHPSHVCVSKAGSSARRCPCKRVGFILTRPQLHGCPLSFRLLFSRVTASKGLVRILLST